MQGDMEGKNQHHVNQGENRMRERLDRKKKMMFSLEQIM